ncbi:MAG: hypothetical protein ACTSQP_15355 [Promethearchaeota archaeon]
MREHFLDFLLDNYNNYSEYKEIILDGIIKRLKDELWDIRLKVIDFLNNILNDNLELIRKYDNELEVLLEEEDVDVNREGLNLLLKIYLKTYAYDDIKNLIELFYKKEWVAQEKILYLLKELIIHKKNLIKPFFKNIILLLDYENFLVNISLIKNLKEIIEYHPDIFDEIFFSLINNDEIDNIESLEDIIEHSIIKHGFPRFLQLFSKIDFSNNQLIRFFNNIIKKLLIKEEKLIISYFSQLIKELIYNLNENDYIKLRALLRANPHYNLYFTIFKTITDINNLSSEPKALRNELIRFLSNRMPELNYLSLNEWLKKELMHRSVNIDELSSKFNFNRSEIMEILSLLLKRKLLNVKIRNNMIESLEEKPKEGKDILFFKKWKVVRQTDGFDYDIQLFIQLRNISSKNLSDLNVFIIYPNEILEKKRDNNKFPSTLEPEKSIILNWTFQKKTKEKFNPTPNKIRLITIYKKENQLFTITKEVDVLLL